MIEPVLRVTIPVPREYAEYLSTYTPYVGERTEDSPEIVLGILVIDAVKRAYRAIDDV
jgi:hypothetical protein